MLERVAHFTNLTKLGQGGMGVVFKAHDTKLRRQVALKLLPPEHVGDAERRLRFLREARAAAAVAHPNIATIYEVGEDEVGRVFIAMELVEGQTIRERLVAKGPLDVAEALRIVREIARGLSKAHELGVVHRDLKSDNVMLTSEGGVKILDFGIAKLRDPESATPGDLENAMTGEHDALPTTEAGLLLGTPGYMSPEQATGKALDARSDLFSLGVMLYEVLTGTLPFRGSTFGEVLVATVRDEPRPIAERAPDVPAAVEAIVARCLAKSPDDRFSSAQALIEAIDARVREDAPTHAAFDRTEPALVPVAPGTTAPPPAPTVTPMTRRRVRTLPALVAIASVVSVVLGVFVWSRSARPPAASSSLGSVGDKADAGTGLLDLPPPLECNAAASAAYRAGIEESRGRGMEFGHRQFERATEADPSCAAAHLRAAIHSQWSETAREHYNRATLLRGRLSPRDQLLLDAYAPFFTHEPPDYEATVSRLTNLTRSRPRDAELLVLVGYLMWARDPHDELRGYAQRAIDVDPGYSAAWQLLATAQIKSGNYDEASRILEHCATAIPSSVDCVYEEATLARWTGRCVDMEAHARSLLARTTGKKDGYLVLAGALASNGAGREAVAEALKQYGAEQGPARAQLFIKLMEARLAMAHGDFDGAELALGVVERGLARSENRADHAAYAQEAFELRLETGNVESALKTAKTFASRQRAWSGTIAEFYGSGEEGMLLVPRMLSIEYHAGKITAQRRDAELGTWLAKIVTLGDPRVRWILEHAAFVETPAEAEAALAVIPKEDAASSTERLAPLRGLPSALYGRVLLLGGRPKEASAELRPVTRRCELLDAPLVQTHAHLWLAEALEASGERAEACTEYGVVLSRWQNARPPSQSARKAEERSKALACPK